MASRMNLVGLKAGRQQWPSWYRTLERKPIALVVLGTFSVCSAISLTVLTITNSMGGLFRDMESEDLIPGMKHKEVCAKQELYYKKMKMDPIRNVYPKTENEKKMLRNMEKAKAMHAAEA